MTNTDFNSLRKNNSRKKQKDRRMQRILLLFGLPILLLFLILVADHPTLDIHLNGNEEMTLEAGDSFVDPGYSGSYQGSLIHIFDSKTEVAAAGEVDSTKLGTYVRTYTTHFLGKKTVKERKVIVQDTTPPALTLKSSPDSYTLPGQEYEEEGYTAWDACDGDLTDKVKVEKGEDVYRYTVVDSSGNKAEADRSIRYDDRIPPELTLNHTVDVAYEGQNWTDMYTAEDNIDGDLTEAVTVKGKVDTAKPGTYTLSYEVKDAHGNRTTDKRTVTVKSVAKNDPSRKEADGKVIYLSFDDGPNLYTEDLLDTLKKYGVKATFFVTAGSEKHVPLIAREAKEGHAVGVHTYTHDMKQIYASEEAYWADFNKMHELIKEQTGQDTHIMRFPGGSSNTISSFNPGIMTRLSEEVVQKGYSYFDWNCSAQDATSAAPSPAQIVATLQGDVQAVTKQGGHVSMVLCHDTKKNTVLAMDSFLPWALEEGYAFLPISESSFGSHQKISN